MTFLTLSRLYSILDVFYQWYIFSVVKLETYSSCIFLYWYFFDSQKSKESNSRPSNPRPKRSRPAVIVSTAPKFDLRKKRRAEWVVSATTWEFETPKLWKEAMFEHLSETRWQAATVVPIEETFEVHCSDESHPLEALKVYIIVLAEASKHWSYKVEKRIVWFDHQNGVEFWGLLMASYIKEMHFYPCLEADLADEWWSWLSNSL